VIIDIFFTCNVIYDEKDYYNITSYITLHLRKYDQMINDMMDKPWVATSTKCFIKLTRATGNYTRFAFSERQRRPIW